MWVARYCRDDVLRAVKALTMKLKKWTPLEDKKVTRLMSYLLHCKGYRKVGFIGDPMHMLRSSYSRTLTSQEIIPTCVLQTDVSCVYMGHIISSHPHPVKRNKLVRAYIRKKPNRYLQAWALK